ncbi:MAG: hypothetical protein ACRDK3_00480 [Actinomycetota bacterium]
MTETLERIHKQLVELYRTEASLELANPEDADAQTRLKETRERIYELHLRENGFFIDASMKQYWRRYENSEFCKKGATNGSNNHH